MHSVAHHSLDVAASASVLLRNFSPPVEVPPSALVALIVCHDIGKFTRPFQAKDETLWPASLGPFANPPSGFPHDDAGFQLLSGPLADCLDPLFANWRTLAARAPILRAIAGHHGRPPRDTDADLPRSVACPVCIAAARAFLDTVFTSIDPQALPPLVAPECHRLAWFLAGLAVAADWLGSARQWFPIVRAEEHPDLRAYLHAAALPQAERAIAACGLLPSAVAPEISLASLFPTISVPRPSQAWAASVALPEGPALFLIEDATGAGKTEAAVLLAHRLMASGRAHGLFFALPTMATANAIYDRLALAYERLFAPGAHPSLVLAHGRRLLNPHFTASILEGASEPEPMPVEPAEQSAGAQCAAWIADDRRKAFLAEIGVGTIDQALLGVLPTRHAPLRLLGLSRRVLIVDEAHAYDAYMFEELCRLIAFHGALGGSTIVLSATLTGRQRRGLSDAFLGSSAECTAPDSGAAYPLAVVASATAIQSEPYPLAPELCRTVSVARVDNVEVAMRVAWDAARAGAAVAWVRNAVDDAIEAADRLRALGAEPMLFHARFAMGDRLAIEREVLRRFGKDSTCEARHGQLLVATQVIEQSLDLDFDQMLSDLAPADLIVQRAGRLWRHQRGDRSVSGPRLFLLAPDPVPCPPESWLGAELRRTGAVYGDHALLWRSARELLSRGEIATPAGIRPLIEAAYDRDAPGAEPEGLSRATDRARGKWLAARGAARQNLLELEHAYERRAGLWEPDSRTPTRLGDPQMAFRLARIDSGRIVPWCDAETTASAWALSEVQVRLARLAGAAPDPEADPLIAAAKQEWPAWDRDTPVLVLRPTQAGSFRSVALGPGGEPVAIVYDRSRGLLFQSDVTIR